MSKRKAKPRSKRKAPVDYAKQPPPLPFKAALELPHAPVPEWQVKGRRILIQVKEFLIGKE